MRVLPLADGPLAAVVVTLRGSRLLFNATAVRGRDGGDDSGCRCFTTAPFEAADTAAADAVLATSPAALLGLAWALGSTGDEDDGEPNGLAPAPPPVFAPAATVDAAAALVAEAAAARCPVHDCDDGDDANHSTTTTVTAAGVAMRRGPFPAARAAALLARVTPVSYHERVALPAGGLVATAVPAGGPGACPGDAAWRVEDGGAGGARVVFVSNGALTADAAPTAPPVDVAALSSADVLIYAPPAAPQANLSPTAWRDAVAATAAAAAAAVDAGGCALIAAPADGSAFATIDAVLAALDARGCGHVPVYWPSPAARAAVAAATACGEWCGGARWERVLGGRPPFALAEAAAAGRLVAAGSVPEAAAARGWAAPCVAVVPPSSVTDPGGAGAALIAAWRADPRAAFVWHAPGGNELRRAAAGAAARIVDAAPPAGPAVADAAALIAALAPAHVVLPAAWEDALLAACAAGAAPPIAAPSTAYHPLADDVHASLPPRAWRALLTADLVAAGARGGEGEGTRRALASVVERDGALTLDAAGVAAGAAAVGVKEASSVA